MPHYEFDYWMAYHKIKFDEEKKAMKESKASGSGKKVVKRL